METTGSEPGRSSAAPLPAGSFGDIWFEPRIRPGEGSVSAYANLERRLARREVILLDGAIGTRLQSMGVPMSGLAWAAAALESHPFTVRRMHEEYVAAGVDIITTNTYSSARHNLEPLGLGDKVVELNLRAVMLAQDARDRTAGDRPPLIAGSVSNFGLRVACEGDYEERRSETSEAQARANLRQQADILAEAGVDFLIAESTGGQHSSQMGRRGVSRDRLAGVARLQGQAGRARVDAPARLFFARDNRRWLRRGHGARWRCGLPLPFADQCDPTRRSTSCAPGGMGRSASIPKPSAWTMSTPTATGEGRHRSRRRSSRLGPGTVSRPVCRWWEVAAASRSSISGRCATHCRHICPDGVGSLRLVPGRAVAGFAEAPALDECASLANLLRTSSSAVSTPLADRRSAWLKRSPRRRRQDRGFTVSQVKSTGSARFCVSLCDDDVFVKRDLDHLAA